MRADSERDDRNRKRKAEWVKRWSEGTEGVRKRRSCDKEKNDRIIIYKRGSGKK